MELQDRLEELRGRGLGVAAISYDSQEVLGDFSRRRGVTFPLLADDDSKVITDFGILNTVAMEAQGPNGDHPDVVADVAKYVSVFGAGSNIIGTPFPGTFMLDGEGRVTARFFEEFYRERNTTANVMLRLGEGLSPIEAIEGETAHLKFTAYASDPAITVGTRFSVAVEIEPNPGMHLYAPGADELGYRVLGLSLSPCRTPGSSRWRTRRPRSTTSSRSTSACRCTRPRSPCCRRRWCPALRAWRTPSPRSTR